jgi:hypothetical protein
MQIDDMQGEAITLDELEQVQGGGVPDDYEGPNFFEQQGPVVKPNDQFLFGADFDYPKKPFEQPR